MLRLDESTHAHLFDLTDAGKFAHGRYPQQLPRARKLEEQGTVDRLCQIEEAGEGECAREGQQEGWV